MATPPASSTDDATDAREAVAARLERLARLVRANDHATVAQCDHAWRAISHMACEISAVLQTD